MVVLDASVAAYLTEMNEALELNSVDSQNFIHLRHNKLITYHLILFYKFIRGVQELLDFDLHEI